jgi:hypothetical protein
MKGKGVRWWVQGGLIILLLTAFLSLSKTSLGTPSGPFRGKTYTDVGIESEEEIRKVLIVLENKIDGREFAEKAKNKLLNLSKDQKRLIIALSEVIVQGDPAPVADMAFLFMTILIIFS